jgi:hypothetical protein
VKQVESTYWQGPNPPLGKVSAKQEPNAKRPDVKRQEVKRDEVKQVESTYWQGPKMITKGPLAPPFPKVDKVDKVERMPRVKESVLIVKPDIQNDIYHLYEGDKYHSVALIPDYKTSVMMNKLFRNIKENANLDALEESDNEDEFEDERDDRFVFLDKSYKMVCAYNYKFKKWAPVRLVSHSV